LPAGRAATAEGIAPNVAALARGVLKAMLLSRIKLTFVFLMGLAVIAAGFWQATTGAGGQAPAGKSFRVTVHEVIHDETAVVTQVDLALPLGSTVELLAGKGKGGRSSLRSNVPDPKRSDGLVHVQLTIFADQVELKERATNAVKFMLGQKIGKLSSNTSETVLMPDGAKVLADILTVPIKSGEYPYGRPTKLVTFQGVTYSLLVTAPK
jgi:hypothetical protein